MEGSDPGDAGRCNVEQDEYHQAQMATKFRTAGLFLVFGIMDDDETTAEPPVVSA
jgi:hypothetical protein